MKNCIGMCMAVKGPLIPEGLINLPAKNMYQNPMHRLTASPDL